MLRRSSQKLFEPIACPQKNIKQGNFSSFLVLNLFLPFISSFFPLSKCCLFTELYIDIGVISIEPFFCLTKKTLVVFVQSWIIETIQVSDKEKIGKKDKE